MSEPRHLPPLDVAQVVDGLRRRVMVVAAIGAVAMLAALVLDPAQFFRSYLTAFVFWTTVPLGCLGLLMVHHLSGGAWGLVIRRLLEAGAKTLPLMAIAFVPLVFGAGYVYQWAQPDLVANDPILQWKQPFLNKPFWVIRTFVYFLLWSGMALLLTRWSAEQDAAPGRPYDVRFSRVSGPGLVVFGLTVSLASIDWMMSVDPHWFSTIYGFLLIAASGLSALTFIVICLAVLVRTEPMATFARPTQLHDLGKLILAFVMLFAYFAFSQFLITWSANLPEEIPWYLRRLSHGWQYVMLALVLLHFALPFAMLLSASLKQNVARLTPVAILVLVMRYVDVHFQVAPQFHEGVAVSWIDLATVVGLGGVWVSAFAWYLKGRPVLPVNDPYFEQAFADHGSH